MKPRPAIAAGTSHTAVDCDLPSGDVSHTGSLDGLLARVEALTAPAEGASVSSLEPVQQELISSLVHSVEELREQLMKRDNQLQELRVRSESMTRAQADALVHSAEIIDELERTKQNLSDARAAAEEAALDTQRLAETIFKRTNDAVFVFEDSACIACNDNAVTLLDCRRQEILGVWPTAFEQARFEDGSSAAEHLRQAYGAIDDENVTHTEVLLRSGNGNNFWSEITFSSFSVKGGGHVLIVVRDITARKQFEAELRRHRDFLNNIISAVPDQLSVKAKDHRLVLANDAFCHAHGMDRQELLDFIPGTRQDSEQFADLLEVEKLVFSTGVCTTTQHQYFHPNGDRRVASVKHSLFSDGETGESFLIATSRDITEDRLREERLQLLASVFKGASEGVAILSADGQILEANPAFARMAESGSSDRLLGRTFTSALQIRIDDYELILAGVESGTAWSGKASKLVAGALRSSYWISLSPSSDRENNCQQIIALVSDITELEKSQDELRRRAMYDSLTGLPNRVYFREHLTELLEETSRSGERITICFVDLDDFKHANDSLGHSCGDELLGLVGKRIRSVLGSDAFVARFGGDEFALILRERHFPMEEQAKLLDLLLIAFREPFLLDANEALVGLSIGLTHYPDDSLDVGTLMRNADIAMYAAKSSGKNAVRQFTTEMQDSVEVRHRVQTKLRNALNDGEIELYFQPQIVAGTWQHSACEALVRWRTSDGNYIPPNQFVPIAEQTGLITALGEMVFEMAAERACQWHANGLLPYIAVNVSPHQLRHPRYLQNLQSALRRTNAKAEWFELEITENAMMDDVDRAIEVIAQLEHMGFRVAIDDFGTGYSSLSYLKSFRINTLKIDLSFTRDVLTDKQSQAIVRSIASLGTGLGLSVVAEGVETAEQAELLEQLGCTFLQGYFIGRPMKERNYREWIQSWKTKPGLSAGSADLPRM